MKKKKIKTKGKICKFMLHKLRIASIRASYQIKIMLIVIMKSSLNIFKEFIKKKWISHLVIYNEVLFFLLKLI